MVSLRRRDVLAGLAATAALSACSNEITTGSYRKLGVAVVGIGGVATRNVLPSLQQSNYCQLAGIVSGDADKLETVGRQFGVPEAGRFTYDDFDRIAQNPAIDLVYIALPNALHAEYTIRSARAGKHVLCEKPMAVTVPECEAMIAACKEAGKSLAVAYRLHYSPHHREMLRSAHAGEIGRVQLIRADIGYPLGKDAGWRLNRKLAGGGVLLEQGVYSVNSARNMMGEDPIEVFGYEVKCDAKRFAEVEETVSWTMRFRDDAVAHCAASYSVPVNQFWAGGANGWFNLDNAYSADAIRANNSGSELKIKQVDQFSAQLDELSRTIQDGESPAHGTRGEDGLRDVRIIAAVYESIRTGKVVKLQSA